MTTSSNLTLTLCAVLLVGCGMQTTVNGNHFAVLAGGGGSGGGTSSGTTSSSSSSGGPAQTVPPASEITVNTTLAFTFLTTAPSSLGLKTGSVLNAASYGTTVASGGLAILTASNLPITVPASDVTFPTTLDGLSVTVGGKAAGIYLVASNQVSFQVPTGLVAGSYPVVVSQGTTTVTTATATVASVAPGLLSAANTGAGVATGETITFNSTNNDWEGPVIFAKDPSSGNFNPLPVSLTSGAWLVLYGTGWMNSTSTTITIGTTKLTPGYAGAQLGYTGLDEVVVWLPSTGESTAAETYNVNVTSGTLTSNTVRVCIAGTSGGQCAD